MGVGRAGESNGGKSGTTVIEQQFLKSVYLFLHVKKKETCTMPASKIIIMIIGNLYCGLPM